MTRATLHPILQSRVGPDVFANRILRLREDVRFKNVGPDVLEMLDEDDLDNEDGLWFDWPFVEFLKNNYCQKTWSLSCTTFAMLNLGLALVSVQRSILLDPGASDMSRE